MGVLALSMGRRGLTTVVVMALLGCVGAGRASAARVYVGDGVDPGYSIALETEAGHAYVLGLSAQASCQYDEAGEPVPPLFPLTAFPAPVQMRLGPHGFEAGETIRMLPGWTEAHVRANFAGAEAAGAYRLEFHEESVDCENSEGANLPFEAHRYLPIGTPRATSPAPGETRVYYDHGGPTRFFARATPKRIAGIRGAVLTECPIGGRPSRDQPTPLFRYRARAKVEDGRFEHRELLRGRMQYVGASFTDVVTISGRVTKEAVVGAYTRVHTTKPWEGPPRRCVTGPLKIEARRYLPARR